MTTHLPSSFFFFFLVSFPLSLSLTAASSSSYAQKTTSNKVYIVYFGEHSGEKTTQEIEDSHHSYLQAVKGSSDEAKASLLYSYKNVINGYSALLTPEEVDKLSEMDEVVSVFESKEYKTKTTRSWDFTSLLEGCRGNKREELLKKANHGKDVIVGMFDSGIWPESKSFSDKGIGAVPASWKGICQKGVAFKSSLCNRKLIGARYYHKGYEAEHGPINSSVEYASPRDKDWHGTHTASTVAGRVVPNVATHGGFAKGTATGGAPLARLAIYKVCWKLADGNNSCTEADIAAAFDDAISDGVHVISISVGGAGALPYMSDMTAVGALHAIKHNIVVSASAGNEGLKTVSSVAPWIISVAASTSDRQISSDVILGSFGMLQGQSITPFTTTHKHQVVYAGDAEIPGKTTPANSGECEHGTLSPALVKGKVVLCLGSTSGSIEVKRAGGVAAIFMGGSYRISTMVLDDTETAIPSTIITINDTIKIVSYSRSHKNLTVTLISPRTTFGNSAPVIANFSSTGPNRIEPNILKPDIMAPGVNILAAWSRGTPIQNFPGHQRINYDMASGTSMSCPHVSGVVALLKAIHPDWSSAAIRSAIMTTATTNNNEGKPIKYSDGSNANPFHYGAGHIQPSKASDPGLVYDATYYDYHLFLCASKISKIKDCPKNPPSQSNLNYPSIAIANIKRIATITRIVTNVAGNKALYKSIVQPPPGFTVRISPPTLQFSGVAGEKKKFTITITKKAAAAASKSEGYAFGSFVWSDGIHEVRSPIAVSE